MSTNEYGLDADYFIKLCAREFSPEVIRNHRPADLARAFARAARTACAEVLGEDEFSAPAPAPAAQASPEDLVVWRITMPSGEVCHFGTEGLAKAWGRGSGTVERVELKAPANLRAVEAPAPTAPDATEQPYSTTSDRYCAELYDEVWEKARALGYGNVTEALADLERMKAAEQPEAVKVPREKLEQLLDRVAHREDPDSIANELCAILLGKEGDV